jgi:hypothetical protein
MRAQISLVCCGLLIPSSAVWRTLVRRLLLSFAFAVLCSVSLAPGARALGLDVLSGGGSLTSGNGLLTFDDFDVIATGSVSSDLSLYDVQALVDGIAITGPISAADGNSGDLFVQFTVSSTQPIVAARLRFNGAAAGEGSSASVTETFEEIEDAQLFVYATGGGELDLADAMRLGARYTSLRVSKDILVSASNSDDDSDGDSDRFHRDWGKHLGWLLGKGHARNHGEPDLKHLLERIHDYVSHRKRHHRHGDDCEDDETGGIATISRIEQRFVTAPEPAVLLLLGAVFTGLAIARRRR